MKNATNSATNKNKALQILDLQRFTTLLVTRIGYKFINPVSGNLTLSFAGQAFGHSINLVNVKRNEVRS